MNASQLKTLKTLLATAGYSSLSNADALTKLNAKTIASSLPVQRSKIKNLMQETDFMWVRLEEKQTDTTPIPDTPYTLGEMCKNTVEYITDPEQPPADFTLPSVQQTFGGLAQLGVFTQAEIGAVMALGNVMISEAQQATGQDATADDVLNARNGDW